MASLVGKALAKKALKDVSQKNTNSKNPFEEEIPTYGKNGRPTGKVKKRKRGIPPGLSAHDGGILKKVRRRAYRLDMSLFNCCGIRFGWSSVVAIIPVIGDAIDCLLALLLVRTCGSVEGGLPWDIRARMHLNIAIDFALGLVPIVGDLADATYRANTRNAWLLESYLTKKLEAEAQGHVSDPDIGLQPLPAKPAQARLQSGSGTATPGSGSGAAAPAAAAKSPPTGVRVPYDSRRGVGYTNGKTRIPDEEMAMRSLQYGRNGLGPHSNGATGFGGQQRNGGGPGRTKTDLATAAVQYGARAVADTYGNNGKNNNNGRKR